MREQRSGHRNTRTSARKPQGRNFTKPLPRTPPSLMCGCDRMSSSRCWFGRRRNRRAGRCLRARRSAVIGSRWDEICSTRMPVPMRHRHDEDIWRVAIFRCKMCCHLSDTIRCEDCAHTPMAAACLQGCRACGLRSSDREIMQDIEARRRDRSGSAEL